MQVVVTQTGYAVKDETLHREGLRQCTVLCEEYWQTLNPLWCVWGVEGSLLGNFFSFKRKKNLHTFICYIATIHYSIFHYLQV